MFFSVEKFSAIISLLILFTISSISLEHSRIFKLGIKYSFIQGAMANITNGKFAAEVSNAGGLGVIATGGMSVEALRENIRICKFIVIYYNFIYSNFI